MVHGSGFSRERFIELDKGNDFLGLIRYVHETGAFEDIEAFRVPGRALYTYALGKALKRYAAGNLEAGDVLMSCVPEGYIKRRFRNGYKL